MTLGTLSIVAALLIALTPVLIGFRGRFSSKVSGFGFTAEVQIDGRKEEKPERSDD